MISSFLLKFFTSKIGIGAIVIAIALPLHFIDRSYAVKEARDGYVQRIELKTAEAERDAILKRLEVVDEANEQLRRDREQADQSLETLEQELLRYENQNDVNSSCTIDDSLLNSL